MATTSEALTQGVRVSVKAAFIPGRSAPQRNVYFFAYHVAIRNEGEMPVQLLARHWIITDGIGRVEEVRGPGVVGAQPRLAPGEAFEYTSFCPLSTSVGSMQGNYEMVTADGQAFTAKIAPFTLATPHSLN